MRELTIFGAGIERPARNWRQDCTAVTQAARCDVEKLTN
jgi:hypothetical protein